jgi:adenylate kinase family enzyme
MEEIEISLYEDKEPYRVTLTDDKVINITGQSGSGKTTYVEEHYNDDSYLHIDTDEIFSDHRFANAKGINRELGEYFRDKYKELPTLINDFDLIYNEILDYCKNINKIIVIDCTLFHAVKDITTLKGRLIILRTSIDNCYNRLIERFKKNNPNYTEEELNEYKNRKHAIYSWYLQTNKFIHKIDDYVNNK